MYLESLNIANMRCFRKTEARFLYPGCDPPVEYPNINILLGNNGMGKSATLKAAALAILSPIIEAAGYVPYSIVRRENGQTDLVTEIEGELILHEQDGLDGSQPFDRVAHLRTTLKRTRTTERIMPSASPELGLWENMYDDNSPAFLLVGYGASRTVENVQTYDASLRRKSRLLRYERVSSLFEEHATLTPLNAWLPRLGESNPQRHSQVIELIQRMLPDGAYFEGEFKEGEYLFQHRGVHVAFGALSDGYRAYIGWICDLLYQINLGSPDDLALVDNRGIVFIDEIDLHLHPEWQRIILPTLSDALPNLQFICTTHSPIVVGTVYSANLHLLLEDGDQASRLVPPEEEVHGLNADQILTSPYFGLTSTRAPSFVEQLRQVSKEAQKGDHGSAKRFTRMMAYGSGAAQVESKTSAYPDWIEEEAKRKEG